MIPRSLRPNATGALLAAAGALAALPHAALAQRITDPQGDFLPTFTGTRGGDLDVLSAQVFFNGVQFLFTSTQNGIAGTTPGGIFVWGVDRGAGTSPGGVFAPAIKFDALIVLNPAGGSSIRDLLLGVSTPLTDVSFTGNTVSGTVPLALLPTRGFAPSAYGVNLWPRTGGGDALVADFAPNATNFAVTVTPEPGTSTLLAGALVVLGGLAHARGRRTQHRLEPSRTA